MRVYRLHINRSFCIPSDTSTPMRGYTWQTNRAVVERPLWAVFVQQAIRPLVVWL